MILLNDRLGWMNEKQFFQQDTDILLLYMPETSNPFCFLFFFLSSSSLQMCSGLPVKTSPPGQIQQQKQASHPSLLSPELRKTHRSHC